MAPVMWQRLTPFFKQVHPGPKPPLGTELVGERLILRSGDPGDWREWRTMRETSRAFLIPWEPRWPQNALSYGYFCSLLRRQWREWRQGTGYAFMVFTKRPDQTAGDLIGGITLGDLHRGVSQKGTLGYWISEAHAGRGYMTEAAHLVCDFAFDFLKLNRIEASCIPHNEPSKKLLRRVGFEEEGYAKAYLQINGHWQDHILWGLLKPGDKRA